MSGAPPLGVSMDSHFFDGNSFKQEMTHVISIESFYQRVFDSLLFQSSAYLSKPYR